MATTTVPPGAMIVTPRMAETIEATASPEEMRRMSADPAHTGIRERAWGILARCDPTVTFEEFQFWAKIERQLEEEENKKYIAARGPRTFISTITDRFSKGVHHDNAKREEKNRRERERQGATEESDQWSGDNKQTDHPKDEKAQIGDFAVAPPKYDSDNEIWGLDTEWRTAARALRTASWGTIFYLVTTDILGWSGAPYVFSSVGYGLGVSIYFIFGAAAAFAGWCIYRVFVGLDSARFPMMSYGDTFFRVFGPKSRHFINIMQSIQQFLSVCVVILGNSQLLVQIAQSKICYVVCFIIVTVVGIASGAIRSLNKIGWICNLSVWLNVVNFIIICVAAAHNPIDYSYILNSTLIKKIEPVVTFGGVPPAQYQQQSTNLLSAELNGVDQMVYAYSGAVLFVAFMAEMRHPMDFWKGMLVAQVFICTVYVFFGAFVYSFYGQYSGSTVGQVVEPYGLQTAGNALSLAIGFFAVFLYFNVGMKTVYLEVFQEILHCPPIVTRRGKLLWYVLGPIYWLLAFVLAASVPNLNVIVGIVGGLFSVNFSYSLPVLCYAGYRAKCAAALEGEGFDPRTGVTTRLDGGWGRWWRGYSRAWKVTVPCTVFVMGSLACSGIGTWASIEGAIQVFGPRGTVATSWGCAAPV